MSHDDWIPPPPAPADDGDLLPPPPPAPASDSDSDTELRSAAATSKTGDELLSPGFQHGRRKSAMKIFSTEIGQSFESLEKRIHSHSHTHSHSQSQSLTHTHSRTVSSRFGGDDDADLPPPPNMHPSLSPYAAKGPTFHFTSDTDLPPPPSSKSLLVQVCPPVLSKATTLPSPAAGRAAAAAAIAATTNTGASANTLAKPPQPLTVRRGSDFKSRGCALPPAYQSTSLTKAKCCIQSCTSFAARGAYCLRHVWRGGVDELEPVNQKLYNVAKEILTTEKSYCDGLRVAYKSFYLRLLVANDMHSSLLSAATNTASGDLSNVSLAAIKAIGGGLLNAQEISAIFQNIEALYRLSENLYADLEEVSLEKVLTTQIGTTLLHYAPQFRIYQTYLENYDDAVRVLGEKRKEKAEFDAFCRLQEKCESLSLESFLIMPVQRLPRYLLLLTELLKRAETPESTAPASPNSKNGESVGVDAQAIADMRAAKEKIGHIANAINQSLHAKENHLKVLAIQGQFEKDSRYQEFAMPTRYLIRDGPLKKRYSSGSRHLASSTVYHFFLFNDILIYAEASKNVLGKQRFKLKHIVPLAGMTAEAKNTNGKNKDIAVTVGSGSTSGKTFDLSCADSADRDSWLAAIQSAIDRLREDSAALKTTSFDGSDPNQRVSASSKLKSMMGVDSKSPMVKPRGNSTSQR